MASQIGQPSRLLMTSASANSLTPAISTDARANVQALNRWAARSYLRRRYSGTECTREP